MKKISLLLFVGLALSADLKITIYPYIHWLFWLILVMPFILRDYFKKGLVYSPHLIISPLIFMFGFLISSMLNVTIDSLVQFLKFVLIFLTLYYFIHYTHDFFRVIFPFLNIILLLNASMLIIGYFGFLQIAYKLTGEGRWGTLLNYPGSLVKIGVISLFYNFMVFILNKKKQKIIPLIFLALSVMVIFFDGSRTGLLLSILLLVFSPFIIWREKLSKKIVLFIPFTLLISYFFIDIGEIINTRLLKNISMLQSDRTLSALYNIDPSRYEMLISVFNKISENPFLGGGPFSTVLFFSNGSSMVVHNAYLQIWGDYGLFGFLGFVGITCSWIFVLPKVLKAIHQEESQITKAIVYSSILLLLYFNLSGFFHPYSTEFSEWMTYFLPISTYYSFYIMSLNKLSNSTSKLNI